jgi:hypothetical protein
MFLPSRVLLYVDLQAAKKKTVDLQQKYYAFVQKRGVPFPNLMWLSVMFVAAKEPYLSRKCRCFRGKHIVFVATVLIG